MVCVEYAHAEWLFYDLPRYYIVELPAVIVADEHPPALYHYLRVPRHVFG